MARDDENELMPTSEKLPDKQLEQIQEQPQRQRFTVQVNEGQNNSGDEHGE